MKGKIEICFIDTAGWENELRIYELPSSWPFSPGKPVVDDAGVAEKNDLVVSRWWEGAKYNTFQERKTAASLCEAEQ